MLPLPAAGAGATGDTTMSSTQHQLIEQCATRLRGIVEALDNIHDTSPHRWSTDLDDVHSSAESLLAMIKDQAPTQAAQGLAGAALAQPSPAQAEQAEAERPGMSPERAAYFMRRFKSEEKLLGPNEQAAVDYVLSLLAQHESIVGALRAELESERNRVNIYVNNNGIRQDNERLRAELRAALARVAELERGKVYVEARQCDECQHGGINDSATGVAACHECDWTGPEPEEDRCPGCQRENCMAAACPQCGARYVLVASEEIAAPVAQAQHSAPEVSGIGRDTGHPRAVVLYLRKEPTDDDLRAIHDGLRSLAAAPGKEGV